MVRWTLPEVQSTYEGISDAVQRLGMFRAQTRMKNNTEVELRSVDESASEVGFYERTYTLQQLQLLRDCWDLSKDFSEPLTSTLRTFIYSDYHEGNNDVLFWLSFLEKIIKDREFPEKEFSLPKEIRTHFVIVPSAKS